MATGNKREVTWYFMPSQPVQLYEDEEGEGKERVREVLYIKREREREREKEREKERRAVMQTNTGEWLGRQRSAARRELKTEALYG